MARGLALVGSIGALAFALLAIGLNWGSIRDGFGKQPVTSGLAAILVAALLLWQVFSVVVLFQGREGSGAAVRKAAVINWVIFVAVLTMGALLMEQEWYGPLISTWGAGWFSSNGVTIGDTSVSLLPVFFLMQWWGAASMTGAGREELWRGAAVGAIGFNMVLGVLAVRTLWDDGVAGDRGSAVHWFFIIGTVLHLAAMWRILASCAFDWLWAGLIGWGCLSSGWYLAHVAYRAPEGGGTLPGGEGTAASIGWVLYVGWYGIAPYLPILAYAVAGMASLGLKRQGAATSSAGVSPA